MGMGFRPDEGDKPEEVSKKFLDSLERLHPDRQGKIWTEIYEIDDLASERGCDYLLSRVRDLKLDVSQKQIDSLKNNYERSIFFYLNHPVLFEETAEEYLLDTLSGWRRFRVAKKDRTFFMKNLETFSVAVQEYYQKEYRGKHCKIEVYDKGNRMRFVAFVEDTYTNEMYFEKEGVINGKPTKRVLFAYFQYRPDKGVLDVKAKGGKTKINALRRIFSRYLLAEAGEVEEVAYELAKFNNLQAMKFDIRPEDGIEKVQLKGLRLISGANKDKFTIDIGNSNGWGAEPILAVTQRLRLNLPDYLIHQAVIRFEFRKTGNGRRKKVTARITYPNCCDLKERDIDIKAQELLRRWGIDVFCTDEETPR